MASDPGQNGGIQIPRELFLETFRAESTDLLAGMEQGLLALEKDPDDQETLHGLFRFAHTIKGSAGVVGLVAVSELAHRLEGLLDRLRARTLRADSGIVSLLLRSVDVLRRAIAAGDAGPGPDAAELCAALEQAAAGPQEPPSATREPSVDSAPPAPRRGRPGEATAPAANTVESAVAPPRPASAAGARTLRVNVARLDRMLNLAGEIGIARSRMTDMLERPGVSVEAIAEAHRAAERLHQDLQDLIMQARLVPLGATFRQHQRTVRDLAAAQGKQIQLVLEGEDVEVDTAVVEQIRDPLTHMVRNAVDHGVEPPAARTAQGKDPCGRISLRAFQEGPLVVVQVSDDGAGLDRERILRRAAERRLVADGAGLSDEEVFAFVFEPGFSTRDEVTELSGRGVGLDVVRRNAEALRGSAAVESRSGGGTTVTMRLPLTLAIIEGFRVRVGDDVYILPLEAVRECVALPEAGERRRTGVLDLRGKPLPYLRLREHFRLGGAPPPRENVVVVQHGGGAAGLAVDALLGEGQAVIKPLGRAFQAVRGISGSTILGDGRVALILDVAALLREAIPGRVASTTHESRTTGECT